MERCCFKCQVQEGGPRNLKKCPICFNLVCDECAYFYGGRFFCKEDCARLFFFYDEEE